MAGGSGERFWPQSRKKRPKQVLSLSGPQSLIQKTIKRMSKLVDYNKIYIVTTESCAEVIKDHLLEMPLGNVIYEPMGRNTAPCIVLAALHGEQYGDPVMIIAPADHIITDDIEFSIVIKSAVEVAGNYDEVVTVGITPTAPETGYGYIHKGEIFADFGDIYRVKRFVEKPDRITAEKYFADGNYFWNSGMIVVRVSVLLELVQTHLPSLYDRVPGLREAVTNKDYDLLRKCYESLESVSIDYGIMEKADNVLMIPGNFGWDDVGSWTALERILMKDKEKNIVNGNHIGVDTSNCIIQGNSKLIATVGLENLIIVESEDCVLVCPKDRAQDVKSIVEQLKKKGEMKYL